MLSGDSLRHRQGLRWPADQQPDVGVAHLKQPPNLSSHDRSTTASSDAVRLLPAPAQPMRGSM
jgi:hypothetical protein